MKQKLPDQTQIRQIEHFFKKTFDDHLTYVPQYLVSKWYGRCDARAGRLLKAMWQKWVREETYLEFNYGAPHGIRLHIQGVSLGQQSFKPHKGFFFYRSDIDTFCEYHEGFPGGKAP
jgi:hypothetical protein